MVTSSGDQSYREQSFDDGFHEWLGRVYKPADLQNMPAAQRRELELAFLAGVHWLNTRSPSPSEVLIDQVRSRLRVLGIPV